MRAPALFQLPLIDYANTMRRLEHGMAGKYNTTAPYPRLQVQRRGGGLDLSFSHDDQRSRGITNQGYPK